MRKFIIAMSAAAFTAATPAQEAMQCVNPDVLNGLVFNGRAESRLVVKRTMPEIAIGFGAPADFTLIGSGVRGAGVATVVAYKTVLESGKAFDSLLDFLYADGWRRETTPRAQPPTVSVAGPLPLAARLCRDGERRNLLVQEIEGVRYATIFGFETSPPRACNAPDPRQLAQQGLQMNPMAAINTLRAGMPQFSFPETARMAGGAGAVDSNMNSDAVSTTARIESPDTAAALAGKLAQQLLAQSWRNDAQWNGTLSTGSTWTRKTDDGKTYWGTLEILSLGKGVYDVGFTLANGSR